SVPSGTPLFSAMLNYRHNIAQSSDGSSSIPGMEMLDAEERTNYPFVMSVEDFGSALGLTAQISKPYDADRMIGYMAQALESLAYALEHTPSAPARQLEVVPSKEQEMLLETWNGSQAQYPEYTCLHELFELQAARRPEAPALEFEGQVLSYGELNARANRLAHHLITLGVQPDSRVAICVDRSLAMIVGLLGILKAGGAYVPLDPAYPSDRLAHILSDSAPKTLLADVTGREALTNLDLTALTVLDPNVLPASSTANPRVVSLATHHLAYMIYTSGSTGKPKGVMIEHGGIVNLVYNRPREYGFDTSSRVLQYTSLSFDHSASEIFTTLTTGATLVLIQDDHRRDRRLLWDFLKEQKITHISLTPSLLQDSKDLPVLDQKLTILTLGEALPATTVRSVLAVVPNATIINDYGPTETTVAASGVHYSRGYEGDVVTIGRPLANKRLYILDDQQQVLPLGAVGELYIGGVGVARGYMNRPDLDAKAFVLDRFSTAPGARMYKTGDLARYLPNGEVLYLGRNDQQVKIRGFRIELGEIESRLVEHPLVREATVLVLGTGNDKRLVAYVAADADEQLAHTLRTHLCAGLPDYMVPAAFVRLETMPLTTNGKLDRAALPEPDSSAFGLETYEAPQGETEETLASIWSELLHLDR
ncbi:hypothetical protein BGZ54_004498, partial [Gamsiella multidivaricata]